MKRIKRFDLKSVMKMSAVLYGLMGLFEGVMFSLFFWIVPFAGPNVPQLPRIGVFFGALAVVFLPILFGLMGALLGGASAYVYNVAARFVGGILVQVE
jgi:hypothetical protein